jgi:hypothetical protein
LATADQICTNLENLCPKPVTPESLSRSPGVYIPVLKKILADYESDHEVASRNQQASRTKGSDEMVLPKLFSVGPLPNMKWRHIDISAELLSSMIPTETLPNKPMDYAALFYRILNFEVFRCHR